MTDFQQNSLTFSQVESRLIRAWKSIGQRRSLAIAGSIFALMFTSLLLILLLEMWLWMNPLVRNSLLLVGFLLSAGLGVYVFNLISRRDFNRFYSDFSRKHDIPEVRYVLDLQKSSDRNGLHDAAIEQQLASIDAQELDSALRTYTKSHEASVWSINSGVALVVSLALFAFLGVSQSDALQRLSSPSETFYKPNPFNFSVAPGDTIIEQGSRLRFEIRFSADDNLPENVQLAIKTEAESDYRIQRLEPGQNQRFLSEPHELFSDVQYYVLMDGYRSDQHEIQVQLLPRFTELTLKVEPPSYTGLPEVELQYPFSRLEAYPGSEVMVRGRSNQQLESLFLVSGANQDSTRLVPDSENPTRFTTSFETTSVRDSLWFAMQEENGLKNRNTFNFRVIPLEDEYPEIRILRPESEKSELEPRSLEIVYELSDDFGFNRVELGYRIQRSFGTGEPETGRIRLNRPAERIAIDEYRWELQSLNLLPMDMLTYWIDVYDNDAYNNFKRSRSGEQVLRISSLTDFLLAQEEREDDVASRLEEFRDAYEQNRREYEDLRQQIMQNEGDNWDQSQAAEDIRESREELSRQLDEIQEQFEELSSDLNDENQLSDETRSMYDDLQKLIQEIDDPDILEAMKKLQEGLENMDRDQVREAMRDIEFDEERYQERLDRTLELFKNLQMNAELDRLDSMLEELASREESLIGDDLPDTEEQRQRQEQIQEDLNKLKERLETLPEKSPRRNRDQIEELTEQLQQEMSEIADKLQEDIDEMNAGESGESQQSQERREEIRDKMNEMRQQAQNAQSMMGQESITINRNALLGLMQNLLLLSDSQETLIRRTSDLVQGSAGFVEVARDQQVISRSFSMITDSLYRVSAEIPRFPNMINDRKAIVQRHLSRAVELLAERDRNRSVAEERVALGGINEIASLLADLLDQLDDMNGEGDGSGGMSAEQMMEQLQKLSGEQAELNQQIQDMINDMAGERMMQDQMDRLDQMARQQNDIRRQMRQLQQGGGLEPGDDILSELERLGEQMEDAINDLRGGVVEERITVQRQQNILSRMLEAERALNERDEDEEREGDRPGDVDRVSPSELTLESLREEIRRRLQDPNQTRFTDEYQQLIQRYFELLEEEERRRSR